MSTFPDDETGQILAEMAAEGADLSKPMLIDFYAAFEFEDTAKLVAPLVKQLDLQGKNFEQVTIEKPDLGGGFELVASIKIIPTYETITAIDDVFTDCVESKKGFSDGWGAEILTN